MKLLIKKKTKDEKRTLKDYQRLWYPRYQEADWPRTSRKQWHNAFKTEGI